MLVAAPSPAPYSHCMPVLTNGLGSAGGGGGGGGSNVVAVDTGIGIGAGGGNSVRWAAQAEVSRVNATTARISYAASRWRTVRNSIFLS
jgi:hypothetical protein